MDDDDKDNDSSRNQDEAKELVTCRRKQLITLATSHLNAARPCIPELEAVLAALAPQVKSVHATGLISFIRDLKHDVHVIEAILHQLQSHQDGTDDEQPGRKQAQQQQRQDDAAAVKDKAQLDAIWKRLEPRTTGAYHSTTRWRVLRRCANLVAVKRTFQGSGREARRAAVRAAAARRDGDGPTDQETTTTLQQMHRVIKEQAKTEVAVVDRGARWVDVRWITADRLARQMADSGWSWGDYRPGDVVVVDPDEWEDIPFVRQVRRVLAAARLNRHEYRIPAVLVVLPNLARGASPDIDVLLEQLPRIDPGVDLVVEDATAYADAMLPPGTQPGGDLALDDDDDDDDVIRTLVGDSRHGLLTATLNLEHTVLVDLISDLTHLRLQPQPWQSRTTRAQIDEENSRPGGVMAPLLYPLLRGRRLVCTHAAAEHFHDMLTTVGTPTERERGRLLVPYHAAERRASPAALRARFDALSERPPPADMQFPVEIRPAAERWDVEVVRRIVERDDKDADEDEDGDTHPLPPVALDIVRRGLLKSSKLSTYMYGWRRGVVTVTSNKEIRAHIKTWVEAGRRADDERGPQLYCVEVTRNLLAKSAMPPLGWVGDDEGGK